MSKAVIFDNVSIVFGGRPQQALPLMDKGMSRSRVQEETSQVLGVHNFQGIRIDGFGRQSERLLSRKGREQAKRTSGTDAKQPQLRQPPQEF